MAHKKPHKLNIVPISEIPPAQDTPTDDLSSLYKFCVEMEQLCRDLKGEGLSASQVGQPWRMFIVKDHLDKFGYYLNCTYRPIDDDMTDSTEGCLSLLDNSGNLRFFKVKRYKTVRVTGLELYTGGSKPELRTLDKTFIKKRAIVFQHEIDHDFQDARLISNIGTELTVQPVENTNAV